MAVQQKVVTQGSVTIGPAQASCAPFPSMESTIVLNGERFFGVKRADVVSISSPVAFVDLLAGLTISAVRLLVLRVQAGSIVLRTSSAAGVDQVVNISDVVYISNPVAGTELTAVSVQGTANIEYLIAGDE